MRTACNRFFSVCIFCHQWTAIDEQVSRSCRRRAAATEPWRSHNQLVYWMEPRSRPNQFRSWTQWDGAKLAWRKHDAFAGLPCLWPANRRKIEISAAPWGFSPSSGTCRPAAACRDKFRCRQPGGAALWWMMLSAAAWRWFSLAFGNGGAACYL